MTAGSGFHLDAGIPVESVPHGSNVLVAGSSALSPRTVALRVLAAGVDAGEAAVVVSADRSARQLVQEYAEAAGAEPPAERFRVVDCAGTGGDHSHAVEWVSSPRDLTGIGMGIVKAGRSIPGDPPVRMGVLSLSTVLRYVDFDRTFNFAHVLAGRVAAADRLGVYTIDPTAHEDRPVNALRALFDCVVELREGEAGREVRVAGRPGGATDWQPL